MFVEECVETGNLSLSPLLKACEGGGRKGGVKDEKSPHAPHSLSPSPSLTHFQGLKVERDKCESVVVNQLVTHFQSLRDKCESVVNECVWSDGEDLHTLKLRVRGELQV